MKQPNPVQPHTDQATDDTTTEHPKRFLILIERKEETKAVEKNAKSEAGIIGVLNVLEQGNKNPILSLLTLENSGEETDQPNLDRPIIARDYTLTWTPTNTSVPKAYKNQHTGALKHTGIQLHTDKLPSFSNRKILIHIGNSAHDTLGCILLGKSYDPSTGMIHKSHDACEALFNLIASEGIENFTLKIKNSKNITTGKAYV